MSFPRSASLVDDQRRQGSIATMYSAVPKGARCHWQWSLKSACVCSIRICRGCGEGTRGAGLNRIAPGESFETRDFVRLFVAYRYPGRPVMHEHRSRRFALNSLSAFYKSRDAILRGRPAKRSGKRRRLKKRKRNGEGKGWFMRSRCDDRKRGLQFTSGRPASRNVTQKF